MKPLRKRTLDFSLLPDVGTMDIIIRFDWDVHAAFPLRTDLPEPTERAKSALMFFCRTGRDDDEEEWRSSAFLRAGLNEFYSMEDAVKWDWSNYRKPRHPPLIRNSMNPLVHVM